jgi:hypothetical protein
MIPLRPIPRRPAAAAAAIASLALAFAVSPGCSDSAPAGKVALRAADSARLSVTARWEPIREFTARANENHPRQVFEYSVETPVREYSGADFAAFLPDRPVALGEIYPLDNERVMTFWRQFDSSATPKLHHGRTGEGAFAALRAYDADSAEVVFRTHGEYGLANGRLLYVPSMLSGRLILERKSGDVSFFHMSLPTHRSPNVVTDIGFETEVEKDGVRKKVLAYDADIVFVPRMELEGGKTDRAPDDRDSWDESLDEAMLRTAIKARYYVSDEIEWLSADDAARRSRETGKPIHLIAMFGALDDESC